MSMLLFHVGDNRYAIENQYIIKIIPRVQLKKMPYAPFYMAGLINWEGRPIPVVDFCQLIEQRDARDAFHSRLILIKDPHEARHVGLLGEKIIEIMDIKPYQFSEAGVYLNNFPYLDGIYSDAKGVIQRIRIDEFFKYLSSEFFSVVKGRN